MTDKKGIRKELLFKRRQLSNLQVETSSKLIIQNFKHNLIPKITDFYKKKLAFYIPANNEVNIIPLIESIQKNLHSLALPKVIDLDEKLIFYPYQIGNKLVNNNIYPAIKEPETDQSPIIPEIIIVPLVAFDKGCYRIGMGGGFYDRTIENLRADNSIKPLFIGVAYDFQYCHNSVFPDKNDQKLDFIISENKIFSCEKKF